MFRNCDDQQFCHDLNFPFSNIFAAQYMSGSLQDKGLDLFIERVNVRSDRAKNYYRCRANDGSSYKQFQPNESAQTIYYVVFLSFTGICQMSTKKKKKNKENKRKIANG